MMPRHSRTIVLSSSLVLVASWAMGCGGAPAGNGVSGNTTANTVKPSDVAPEKKSTESTVSTGTSTPTNPTKANDEPSAPSPFHILADVDYELTLRRLGKNSVFEGGGQILPARDNTITFDPKYALTAEIRGDGVTAAFQNYFGVFPEAFYASVVRASGRTGLNELYKWTGTRWTSEYATQESMSVLDVQPWINGTALVLEFNTMFGDFSFSVLPKGSKVFLPEPNEFKRSKNFGVCASGFIPTEISTVASGHAFVVGMTCNPNNSAEDGQSGVKHYSSANPKGVFQELPGIGKNGLAEPGLIFRNEKDAYLAADLVVQQAGRTTGSSPYLAHYDGTAWTTSTLPFSDSIVSFDYDAQGKLWVISNKGAIYSRVEGGSWTPVVLPPGPNGSPIEPKQIWVRAPGDEWIVGIAGKRSVVLHSGPPGPMAQLPDLETMEDKVTELAMPTPLTPRCMTPFVLLYTLSKVAPPDFDYPATREALKGWKEFSGATFIEFKRLDKRFMGAMVQDVEMGNKMVRVIKDKVPNSSPQLVCHAPKPSRVLEFNFEGNE